MPDAALQFDDIQGIVLSGYAHLSHAGYVFLQITDSVKARRWLKDIIREVTNAVYPTVKPATCLNIAFTYQGLAALELHKRALDSFSAEFKEGIAEPFRARLMGDIGPNAPDGWDYGGKQPTEFHMLLMLFAVDEPAREAYLEEQRARFEANGLREVCVQHGYRTKDSHEHFGFFDGISQPTIAGSRPVPRPTDVQAGEFLFGHLNEYGLISPVPGHEALGSDVLGFNGTYLVYRKLAQDVKGFHDFLRAHTDGTQQQMDWLGAKMVGRWPSGAPMTLSPHADDPKLGEDEKRNNDFKYAELDPHGYACPVGSHIRRTNPRDSLEPDPPSSLVTVNRHRILRRGRSYGPLYSEETIDRPRGIVFIALNADIKRQFEFMQQAWVNDPRFAGLYDNKDPLVADRAENCPTTSMVLQRSPFRREVKGVPRFVTMRGGGYFFLPSLTALNFLASQQVG